MAGVKRGGRGKGKRSARRARSAIVGMRGWKVKFERDVRSLPHFRPRDGTLENHCFQILTYLRVYE